MPDDLPHPMTCQVDGCVPVRNRLHPAHDRPATTPAPAARPRTVKQVLPQILLGTTPAWRGECLDQVAHIPSGYTYLAQLMGHDLGSSVIADSVPYARDRMNRRARRYNLIDNPLTLETVYGPGPSMLAHVYDPETMLFRLTPGARLSRIYARGLDVLTDPDPRPIRALYDERNRDSLMLHELVVAWMQFHNLNARALMAQGASAFAAYWQARVHAVRVWHAILLGDLLPRFLHADIAALPPDDLPESWALDEASLLHGLCRTYHALPLAAYDLGRSGRHNLGKLLKRGYAPSEAETDWSIDWPLFFGQVAEGPMTGISASVAPELRAPVTAAAVIALDVSASQQTRADQPGSQDTTAAIAGLPGNWPRRITPQVMAADFAAAHPGAPVRIDEGVLEWGPLYQFLMVEAQLHGQSGGLGPLGSAFLRGSVLASIQRVVLAKETTAMQALPRPATMLDLINFVRTEKRT